MAVHLPVLPPSSLRGDGTRAFPYPADVTGRFATARKVAFAALVIVWAALPWVQIGGHPAVFLDVPGRQFFLFGLTFNAQDTWLLFFFLTGVAFALVYVTAVAGRAWCGWACPHTVFLDFFYRPIERLLEGPREARMRRDAGPWTADKVARKTVKHALFAVVSIAIAHMFLAYFVSMPGLFRMVRGNPAAHPEAFAWAMATSALLWGNFGWFREQLCLIVCPYGRLQAVLVDEHSLVVGYDEKRGEPRGKAKGRTKIEGTGDCVDCRRCVVVCPTGIDIRNGIQLDCTGCTACIDACDDVMDQLGRPRGLVRYDSLEGLAGRPRRLLRPRILAYTGLGLAGALAFGFAAFHRSSFEANLLRIPGAPYVVESGTVRNAFEIHLVNKRSSAESFVIEPEPTAELAFVIPLQKITLAPMAGTHAPVFVSSPAERAPHGTTVRVRIRREGEEEAKVVAAPWLAPAR